MRGEDRGHPTVPGNGEENKDGCGREGNQGAGVGVVVTEGHCSGTR